MHVCLSLSCKGWRTTALATACTFDLIWSSVPQEKNKKTWEKSYSSLCTHLGIVEGSRLWVVHQQFHLQAVKLFSLILWLQEKMTLDTGLLLCNTDQHSRLWDHHQRMKVIKLHQEHHKANKQCLSLSGPVISINVCVCALGFIGNRWTVCCSGWLHVTWIFEHHTMMFLGKKYPSNACAGMHVHTHTHTHTHTHACMHMHTCMHTHTCMHAQTLMYAHTHTSTHIHLHTHIHTHTHKHTHTHTHSRVHTHTHTPWQVTTIQHTSKTNKHSHTVGNT